MFLQSNTRHLVISDICGLKLQNYHTFHAIYELVIMVLSRLHRPVHRILHRFLHRSHRPHSCPQR
jgi:hypothetical protein